jgi:hypothetical protein
MNKLYSYVFLFCIITCALSLRADTVVLKDGSTCNGKVSYRQSSFEVLGRVNGSAVPVFKIDATLVTEVRFNQLDNNSTQPPFMAKARGSGDVKCEASLADKSKPLTGRLGSISSSGILIDKTRLRRDRVVSLRIVE